MCSKKLSVIYSHLMSGLRTWLVNCAIFILFMFCLNFCLLYTHFHQVPFHRLCKVGYMYFRMWLHLSFEKIELGLIDHCCLDKKVKTQKPRSHLVGIDSHVETKYYSNRISDWIFVIKVIKASKGNYVSWHDSATFWSHSS